jgi:hypothetical protein
MVKNFLYSMLSSLAVMPTQPLSWELPGYEAGHSQGRLYAIYVLSMYLYLPLIYVLSQVTLFLIMNFKVINFTNFRIMNGFRRTVFLRMHN